MSPHRATVLIAALLICIAFLPATGAQPLVSYDLDLTVNYQEGTFDGRCVVNFTNETGTALSELFFRLFANDTSLYGTAFLHVDSVSIQTESVPFALFVDDTVLMVPLTTPLEPNERVSLDFAFRGRTSTWYEGTHNDPSQTGYGLLTKSPSTLTLTAVYPMLAVFSSAGWALDPSTGFGDTLMGNVADYRVLVTVEPGPTPVSSGKLMSASQTANGSTAYAFTAAGARDFSLVLVDDGYKLKTADLEHATLRAWFPEHVLPTAEQTIEMASFAFTLYENLVGPAPFDEIDLVEVPLQRAAGVEFSGLIFISSTYARDPRQLFFSVIVSHEMAHQWFYAGVGNDVSEHPWLDESFATYLSYEFLTAYSGETIAQRELDQWSSFYSAAQQGRPDLVISSPRYAFPDSSTYSSFVYSGGAVFLHALRDTLGDDAFYSALQTYYSEFLYRIASPMEFISILEDTCSCTLDDLLSQFGIMP